MKNPWMSMWLSGANAWTGAARGMMAAEAKRSQRATADEMTRQAMAFWFPALALAKPVPARRKRR